MTIQRIHLVGVSRQDWDRVSSSDFTKSATVRRNVDNGQND